MILRHRDRELLCFEWVRGTCVRILTVIDAERQFLPMEFGEERLRGGCNALRYLLEAFRFKKHRHYDWTDESCVVLSGFLPERASEIRCFGRKADGKFGQSLNVESANSKENVGVRSSSGSCLNASEQRAVHQILRNSFVTEEELANQLTWVH